MYEKVFSSDDIYTCLPHIKHPSKQLGPHTMTGMALCDPIDCI